MGSNWFNILVSMRASLALSEFATQLRIFTIIKCENELLLVLKERERESAHTKARKSWKICTFKKELTKHLFNLICAGRMIAQVFSHLVFVLLESSSDLPLPQLNIHISQLKNENCKVTSFSSGSLSARKILWICSYAVKLEITLFVISFYMHSQCEKTNSLSISYCYHTYTNFGWFQQKMRDTHSTHASTFCFLFFLSESDKWTKQYANIINLYGGKNPNNKKETERQQIIAKIKCLQNRMKKENVTHVNCCFCTVDSRGFGSFKAVNTLFTFGHDVDLKWIYGTPLVFNVPEQHRKIVVANFLLLFLPSKNFKFSLLSHSWPRTTDQCLSDMQNFIHHNDSKLNPKCNPLHVRYCECLM